MKSTNENKTTMNEVITSGENILSSASNNQPQSEIQQPHRNRMSDSAVDFYKKLCLKLYISTNSLFVNLLKQESMNLCLDLFTLKEMNLINKTIGKFNYFKHICLSGCDLNSNISLKEEMNKNNNNGGKQAKSEDQKAREGDILPKLYLLSQGIAKNLSLSAELKTFKLVNIDIKSEIAEFLSEGIINNSTLKNLIINNCNFSNESYEILIKGVLTHKTLESVDFSSNNLSDKSGNMIGRIISRQSQRRDQIVWMYGLRNEKPTNNDYAKGLVEINLSNNNLSDISADDIANALGYDVYLRKINLSNNQIFEEGCKKFIHVLRKNNSIVNLDLSNNPGYTESIKKRLVLKLIKNIKLLKSCNYSPAELVYINQYIDLNQFFTEVPDNVLTTFSKRFTKNQLTGDSNIFSQTGFDNITESNMKQSNNLKKSKKFEEKRNKSKEKNQKKKTENNIENIMKEFTDNLEEKENDIHLSEIDHSNSNNLKKISSQLICNDDQVLFNYHSDNEILLDNSRSKSGVLFHCKCCKKYNNELINLHNKNKELLKENNELKKLKRSNKNPTQTNGSLNQGHNNNPEENQNQVQNQTQTYQAENLSLTNFPMNISSGVQKILPPTTGEEGSYEAYYYKIEHLLLELTRLMDNVENNINNTNNPNNTNNQNMSRPESNTQINRAGVNDSKRKVKIFKSTDPIEEEN